MKKILIITISLFMAYLSYGQNNGTDPNNFHKGQLYVKVADNENFNLRYQSSNPSYLNESLPFLEEFGVESIKKTFRSESAKLSRIYEVKLDTLTNLDTLISHFTDLSFIEYAEKMPKYQFFWNPNDPLYSDIGGAPETYQWSMNTINASSAVDLNTNQTEVVIAITDDAINMDHPDLQANIWVNQGEVTHLIGDNTFNPNSDDIITAVELAFASGGSLNNALQDPYVCNGVDSDNNGFIDDIFGWDFADNDNNPMPPSTSTSDFSHGTHVAGIAAAVTDNVDAPEGIASISNNNAKIMCIKLGHDDDQSLNPTGANNGIEYCIDNDAQIINMSWGAAEFSSTLEDLLEEAAGNDILSIAGAGNENDSNPFYPASFNNITMSVAGSTHTPMDEKMIISTFNTLVDVLAPGDNIISAVNGIEGYMKKSGTSMAAPLVASLAALMKSTCPECTSEQIKTCIIDRTDASVLTLPGNAPAYTGQLGSGRIDAFASMTCITNDVIPTADFTPEFDFICPNTDLQLFGQSAGYNINNWEWILQSGAHFSTGITGLEQNPSVTFDNPGSYDITLNIRDEVGNIVATVIHIIDVAEPMVNILSSNVTGCRGQQTSIVIEFTGNPPFEMQYTVNGTGDIETDINQNPFIITVDNPSSGDNHIFEITQISDATDCTAAVAENVLIELEDCECVTKINNNWVFGEKAGYNFNNQSSFSMPNFDSGEGAASISKPNGELLFYTNGERVYDANSTPITFVDDAAAVMNGNSSSASIMIVPYPGNINQYYIFTTGNAISNSPSLRYSIVRFDDITLNDPTGEIIEINQPLINTPNSEALTLIQGTNKYWLIAKGVQSTDDTQLTVGNDYIPIEIPHFPNPPIVHANQNIGGLIHNMGYCSSASSRDGELIAMPHCGIIQISSFDKSTGQITHEIDIEPIENSNANDFIYDLCFSRNKEYLFFSMTYTGVGMINLSTPEVPPVILPLSNGGGWFTGIEMGPDGNIYAINYNNGTLDLITDVESGSPTYSPFAIPLQEGTVGIVSLPHWIPELDFTFETTASCFNSSTGSASVNAGGASSSYSIYWTGGGEGAQINNLSAGDYSVTVIDNNTGCASSEDFIIEEADPINIQFEKGGCAQGEGSIEAIVTGGTPPYSFAWDNNGEITSLIDNLSTGTYTLTVTDENGCEEISTTNLDIIALEVEVRDTLVCETCFASCIQVIANISGGTPEYNYEWSNTASGTTSGNPPGHYLSESATCYVTVIDANGCRVVEEFEIEMSDLSVEVEKYDGREGCGGSATLIAPVDLGPYQYEWEGPNGFASDDEEIIGLAAGTYYYTVTDANGCERTDALNISPQPCGYPHPPVLWICDDNDVLLEGSPDPTILWSTGQPIQDITVDEAGVYSYTIEDQNGCRACPTYFIVRNIGTFEAVAEYSCTGEGINEKHFVVRASEGFDSYIWSVVYLNEDGTPYTLPPSFNVPTSNTNTIIDDIETINYLYDNGVRTYFIVTATIGSCTVTETVEVQHFRTLYRENYVIQDNQLYWLNANNSLVLENIPLTELSDGAVRINGNIEIKDDLTVTDASWMFEGSNSIIVSGANTRFYIKNTTISNNYCTDTPWRGITVFGDPNKPHSTSYQASVRMIRNSKIVGADVAIISRFGGIVQILSSKFINNGTAIILDKYDGAGTVSHQSNSYISKCLFETNPDIDLISGINFTNFVVSYKFPNIEVKYSTLRNLKFDLPFDQRGTGIYAFESDIFFGHGSILSNYEPLMYNLTNGIISEEAKMNEVDQANFKDIYQGVLFRGGASTVKSSNFNDLMLSPQQDAWQVRLEGCETPEVTLNNFENGVAGLVIKDCNTVDEDFNIYKNNFEGFTGYSSVLTGHPSSIVTMGDNGSVYTGLGLKGVEFKCNSFNNYDYAISLMTGQVRREQGNELNDEGAVKNIFSNASSGSNQGQFFISSNAELHATGSFDLKYKYYYPDQPANGLTLLSNYTDLFPNNDPDRMKDIGVFIGGQTPFVYDQVCQDNPDDNGGGTGTSPGGLTGGLGLSMAVNQINVEESIKEDELEAKVDKGNTELLLSDIYTATPDNYTEVVEDLQITDSYISDEVALEFMEKDVNRPIAKTVALIANSPLPEKAKQKIDDLSLTDNLKNLLKSYQTGLSKRELDEMEIRQLKQGKQNLFKQTFRSIMKDTLLSDSLKSIEIKTYTDLLADQNEWSNRKKAAQLMIKTKRMADAQAQIAELRQDLNSLDEAYAEHSEQYLNLLELKIQLSALNKQERKTLITQKQSELEDLRQSDFADGKIEASILLEEAELIAYDPTVLLPTPEQQNRNAMAKVMQTQFDFSRELDMIDVYPNPTKDILNVEFVMFNGAAVDKLGVYDLNGRLLMSQKIDKSYGLVQIDVRQLAPGSYIVAFGDAGVSNNSKKFVVIR